jgi:hypothetical protein
MGEIFHWLICSLLEKCRAKNGGNDADDFYHEQLFKPAQRSNIHVSSESTQSISVASEVARGAVTNESVDWSKIPLFAWGWRNEVRNFRRANWSSRTKSKLRLTNRVQRGSVARHFTQACLAVPTMPWFVAALPFQPMNVIYDSIPMHDLFLGIGFFVFLCLWLWLFRRVNGKGTNWSDIVARFPMTPINRLGVEYKNRIVRIGPCNHQLNIALAKEGICAWRQFRQGTPCLIPWSAVQTVDQSQTDLFVIVDYAPAISVALPIETLEILTQFVPAPAFRKAVSTFDMMNAATLRK